MQAVNDCNNILQLGN